MGHARELGLRLGAVILQAVVGWLYAILTGTTIRKIIDWYKPQRNLEKPDAP